MSQATKDVIKALGTEAALDWLLAAGWNVLVFDREGPSILIHRESSQLLVLCSEDWDILRAKDLPDAGEKMGAPP